MHDIISKYNSFKIYLLIVLLILWIDWAQVCAPIQ